MLSVKMDCFKEEKCSMVTWFYGSMDSSESKFDILVGNHRCCFLQAKEEGDLPACY